MILVYGSYKVLWEAIQILISYCAHALVSVTALTYFLPSAVSVIFRGKKNFRHQDL